MTAWNGGMEDGITLPYQRYGMQWHGIGKRGKWYKIAIPQYHGIGMGLIYHSGMGTLKVR